MGGECAGDKDGSFLGGEPLAHERPGATFVALAHTGHYLQFTQWSDSRLIELCGSEASALRPGRERKERLQLVPNL